MFKKLLEFLFKKSTYENPYPKCPDCDIQLERCGCGPTCTLVDCPKCGKDLLEALD